MPYLSTKTWTKVTDMYDLRERFRLCAFMDKILLFGGYSVCYTSAINRVFQEHTDSCVQFDTKHKQWKEVSRMNETRSNAVCAVLEGRIVIAGGWREGNNVLRIVESYDVIADEWSPMPNMIESRCGHGLVAVNSKLFVIGDTLNDFEVFDNNCKKIVSLKSPGVDVEFLYKVIPFGSNFLVFADILKAV